MMRDEFRTVIQVEYECIHSSKWLLGNCVKFIDRLVAKGDSEVRPAQGTRV